MQFPEPGNSESSHGNHSLRNSIAFGSLPIFKSGRNDIFSAAAAANMDPASVDDEPAGKRLKSDGSVNNLRSSDKVNVNFPVQNAKEHASPSNFDQHRSGNFPVQSSFASDFEQEMNAALGLSPTEARPQHAVNFEPRLSPIAIAPFQFNGPQSQPKDNLNHATSNCVTCAPANEEPSEKSSPGIPSQPSALTNASDIKETSQPSIPVSEATSPSIRPVSEDVKSLSSPEERLSIDFPVEDVSAKNVVPEVPPKDASPSKEDPPSLPAKDMAPRGVLSNGFLPPVSKFTARQPSISTLGVDEDSFGRPRDADMDTPPSPLQQPVSTEVDDLPDTNFYNQFGSKAQVSEITLPSLDDVAPGFGSAYPSRPPSSAEILESKRRSISGLPPSTPCVHSPLRNEVRYSPGTRSSMLSFGSQGRQSNNSKGTRPNTPANEVLQHPEPGESKIDKLKNFGRRRRVSVGNALSGLQDGLSKELQGLQTRSTENGSQQKESVQKKRAFKRISVCDTPRIPLDTFLTNHRAFLVFNKILSLHRARVLGLVLLDLLQRKHCQLSL